MIKFQLYIDKKKEHRWRLISSNGKIVADCAEGYKQRASCVKAVNKIIGKIVFDKFKIVDA